MTAELEITLGRLSNSLTDLADKLQQEVEAHTKASIAAVGHAMTAGAMLCDAKAGCQHGEWLPFLKRAGLNERTAQRWMRLHRGQLNSDIVSHLGGVTPALEFLRHREWAMHYFDKAEAAAIAHEATGEGEVDLRPLQSAIDHIEVMVGMLTSDNEAITLQKHD